MSPQYFSIQLSRWYAASESRDMPWQDEKNPYKVWVSEIMLQQTSVEHVKSYFNAFIEAFPSIEHLSRATEEEVLHFWQGLGYNSRARNLHAAAVSIVQSQDGTMPDTYEELLQLKGIGSYTAAAIMAFAYDAPYYVIDVNVIRVYARIKNRDVLFNSNIEKKEITTFLEKAGKNYSPSTFNQAIMNFGATVCTKNNPLCITCPMILKCEAYAQGTQHCLPKKKKRKKRKKRYFHYFWCQYKDTTLIQKRNKNDIWKGLYEFPLYEAKTSERITKNKIIQVLNEKDIKARNVKLFKSKSQILTHQSIKGKVYKVEVLDFSNEWTSKKTVELSQLPFVGLLRKLLV